MNRFCSRRDGPGRDPSARRLSAAVALDLAADFPLITRQADQSPGVALEDQFTKYDKFHPNAIENMRSRTFIKIRGRCRGREVFVFFLFLILDFIPQQ